MKNLLRTFGASLLLTLCGSSLYSCMDSDDIGDNYRTFEGEMAASFISGQGRLSEFEKAMKQTGVYALLESYGKYTCFVPTDDAMHEWYAAKGMTLEEMDSATVREMVYYHFIDGEATAAGIYLTEDFPEGSFPAQNMVGRYLTATVRAGAGNWSIKNGENYADIISPNNEALNGVIHIVDRVLEGNNDLLPDFIASKEKYKIFGEALIATGWRDSMLVIDDPGYEIPTNDLPNGSTLHQSTTGYYAWPSGKKFLYTIFAEPDSIMALREGITSLDDLREYAKRVYPEGADIKDETHPENSLRKFVGYHILDVQRSKTKLVINKNFVSTLSWHTWRDQICDETYRVNNYYVPMQPNTLLTVDNINTTDFDENSSKGIPVLNCPYSPYDPQYGNMAMVDEINGSPIIRLLEGESDQYCQNGVLHGINNMLVFDQKTKAEVFHSRIRTDFRVYMGEGVNNGFFYDGDKGYNWFHTSAPDGYFKNIKFTSNSNTYMMYEGRTPHDYLMDDHITLSGNFDFTIKVGPLPKGTYEVRLGYCVNTSAGAVVQVYIDGIPCGIPIDTRVSAYNGDTGWIQDWQAIQESGSSRFAGMGESEEDPYGFENDKNLRNHGYMKAPNSYVGWNYYQLGYGDNLTARNVDVRLRRILGIFNWTEDGPHDLRLVAMRAGSYELDYIEFIPTDLIEDEDQH
ncbi:MAG: fasciclin domain-containing protein [Coprobacter sp.]|nr:fasciclin domain-containing protein [Coprobacter sp.]